MSSDPDVELVLAAYRAYGRGDIATAVADMHPNVVWIEPDDWPNGGERRGPDAVAEYLRASYQSWRSLHSVARAERRGERSAVSDHAFGTLSDGYYADTTVADVFTVVDGRVTHMQAYADP